MSAAEQVVASPKEALEAALARHRAAFRAEPYPDLATRRARVEALADALWARREDLVAAVTADFGHRSRHETLLADVGLSVMSLRDTAKHIGAWMEPERRKVALHFLPGAARILPQPLGVVGIIAPWNYPVQLAVVPMGAALAAGNRVMLKPSELTPATSKLLAEILDGIFAEDLVSVHLGDAQVGAAFSGLRFDHLLFTGSTAVGRRVMMAAAENLVPVTLELGGKSPAILGPGGSVKRAADRIANGKVFNAGQTCIAPDYVLVTSDKKDAMVEALKEKIAARLPTLASNDDYTAIVNERHHARLQHLLDDAREKGATIVEVNPAGEDLSGTGKIAPTLVLDATEDMEILQEEIFGPLLPIVTVGDLDEAIAYVLDHPRPLSLYLFESRGAVIDDVLKRTHAGGVTVNDTLLHVAQEDLPFGGVGPSGMGAYHGKEGFDTFSHRKSVFEQPRLNTSFLLDAPFGKQTERLVRLLVGLS